MKRSMLLAMVISTYMVLAVAPSLATGAPFSADVWPLIRIAERLTSIPGARIWMDSLFDGYNNRWPGVVLAASFASLILGIGPENIMVLVLHITVLLAHSLTLYLVLRWIGRSALPALLAGLLYPASLALDATTVKKEAYALPLLYLALYITASRKPGARSLIPLALASTALTLSHHLASLVLVGLAMSYIIVSLIDRSWGNGESLRPWLTLLAMHGSVFTLYYLAYGGKGLRLGLEAGDVASYALYLTLVYGAYIVHRSSYNARGHTRAIVARLAALLALGLTVAATRTPILPGTGTLPLYTLLYTTPFIIGMLLVPPAPVKPVKALGLLLASTYLYVLLTASLPGTVYGRLLAYTGLLLAFTLASASSTRAAAAVALVTAVTGTVAAIGLVLGTDPLNFYHRYTASDVSQLQTLLSLIEGEWLAGDTKVAYFASMVKEVSLTRLSEAANLGELPCPSPPVVLHEENLVMGFSPLVGGKPRTEWLATMNVLYNGGSTVCLGCPS